MVAFSGNPSSSRADSIQSQQLVDSQYTMQAYFSETKGNGKQYNYYHIKIRMDMNEIWSEVWESESNYIIINIFSSFKNVIYYCRMALAIRKQ